MPVLRYNAARPVPYNGDGPAWRPGEAREVSDSAAAHLLSLVDNVGPWFEAVAAEVPAVAPPPAADEVQIEVVAPVLQRVRNAVSKNGRKK